MSSLSYITPPPSVPTTRHPSVTLDSSIIELALKSIAPTSLSVHVDATPDSPQTRPLHPYGYSKHSFPRAAPCSLPHFSDLNETLFSPRTPGKHAISYSNAYKPRLKSSAPSSPHPHGPPLYSCPLKTSRDELDESPAPGSPNARADKRRRTRKVASASGDRDSIGSNGMGESPDGGDDQYAQQGQGQKRMSGSLAPIKPIGFAAARENRRESGGMAGEPALPSPVVMGFDFQKVDDDQLKTVSSHPLHQELAADSQVRDTISIKSQQEALIAQRRRDLAASTPNTPKEMTFKGWQPKEATAPPSAAPLSGSGSGSVGKRRDKTRDKVERMSINTAGGDKDAPPGSKVGFSARYGESS